MRKNRPTWRALQSLNQMLEKNRKWCCTRQCEEAFREVKQLITSELELTHYDPEH